MNRYNRNFVEAFIADYRKESSRQHLAFEDYVCDRYREAQVKQVLDAASQVEGQAIAEFIIHCEQEHPELVEGLPLIDTYPIL